jgi:phosphopantetheinyl transferase (holo-ACP synthase)
MSAEQALIGIIERVTGTDYSARTNDVVRLSSHQHAVVRSLCRRDAVPINLDHLGDGMTVRQMLGLVNLGSTYQSGSATEPDSVHIPSRASAGLGCDIQSLEEFRRTVESTDFKASAFLVDVMVPEEISYCEGQTDPVASLCGVFAAKEAVVKAGHDGPLRAIRVQRMDGAPIVEGYAVSIAHSGQYCLAVAQRIESKSVLPEVPTSAPLQVQHATRAAAQGLKVLKFLYNAAIVAAIIYLLMSRVLLP